MSAGVTSMTQDIAAVSSKLDRVAESVTHDIAVLSSKVNNDTETFRSCANFGFDDDFCMT